MTNSKQIDLNQTLTEEELSRMSQNETKQSHGNIQVISDMPEFKFKIGYWWSDKKGQKLNINELTQLFEEKNCLLVKLDLDKSLEEQGPFSLIVHKISDVIVRADQGDLQAKKTINAFESYVRKHPETVIMDPLDNNRALLDRFKQYRLIEQSELAKGGVVFAPPFVHLTSTNIDVNRGRIRRSKITFPLVCKPILAQGSTGAHQMCIIFNEAGLKDVKPPCVAQSFVNHNARLFKLFVIKDKYYIMERPSLKNFQAGDQETVFFYSHDISKPNSCSSLTKLDESDQQFLQELISKMKNMSNQDSIESTESNRDATGDGAIKQTDQMLKGDSDFRLNNDQNPFEPNKERLDKIVRIISEKLGLTFYGIDVIIENGTSRYAIIDMNTFPGYDGVENFLTIFRDVVCDAIPGKELDHQNQLFQNKIERRKPTEIDSGIEST